MKTNCRSFWSLKTWLVICLMTLAHATSMFAQDTPNPDKLGPDKLDTLPSTTSSTQTEKLNLGEIRRVLRQLDSDQSAERDKAEKQLIEFGAPVLPFLPEITSSTSGELKIRLQRIRQQLQISKIETYFEASPITLTGKMTVADAIASIAKQSKNMISIEADGVGAKELEFDAKNKPFWEVMDTILSQANLRINAYANTEGMVLMPGGESSVTSGPLPYASGPFQIRALSAQSSIQFGQRTGGQLDVSLQVNWEPRLKPVYIQLPMATMKAKLSDTELSSTNPAANPEIPVNSTGSAAQIDLQFARPQRSAHKIDKLSGEFIVAVPSEKHKYVFEKFASGKRQSEKYGEVTVTLENARRNGSVFEMRILAEFKESQGALDSFRGWILSNRAYLVDEKQNQIDNVGFQTYSVTSDAVGVAFLFQINGDPNSYTLVYESPGMITRQTVKFELEHIDLP